MVIALTNAKLLLKLQPYVSDSDDTVSTLASWIAFYQVLHMLVIARLPAMCFAFNAFSNEPTHVR